MLLEVPVDIHARSAEHMDALKREFELIRLSEADPGSVPHQLHDLMTQLDQRFGGMSDQPRAELRAAAEAGRPSVDLEYLLPSSAADACRRLAELLDEADAFCRQGEHLLTLATPEDALAYRRWFLGQMIAQIGGEPPTPWPEYRRKPSSAGAVDGEPGHEAENGDHPTLPDGWTLAGTAEQPVLRITDDLDLHSAPLLRTEIAHLLRLGGHHVTVDLSHAVFVDSVALSVLMSAHNRLGESGATLSVIAPPNVVRVISTAGLDQVLHVYPAE